MIQSILFMVLTSFHITMYLKLPLDVNAAGPEEPVTV